MLHSCKQLKNATPVCLRFRTYFQMKFLNNFSLAFFLVVLMPVSAVYPCKNFKFMNYLELLELSIEIVSKVPKEK